MKINEKRITEYRNIFEEYFNKYYADNREVEAVSFREMLDEKGKPLGFTAEIQYKNFTQNVNVFWNVIAPFVINSIFTFKAKQGNFCCHFVDVLDYFDSDDISFYTYTNCVGKEKTIRALDNVMNATKKYWFELNLVSQTPDISQSICEEIYADAIDDNDALFDTIEETVDMAFITYEILNKANEMKAYLKSQAKKNQLETKFEKRAYRVLNNETSYDAKEAEKQRAKFNGFDKTDKLIVGIVLGTIGAIFAVVFAVVGYKLDVMMYSDWLGRNASDTVLAFLMIGAFTGVMFGGLLPVKIYRPLVSEERFESIQAFIESEKTSSKTLITVGVLSYIALVLIMFSLGAFNGVGFTNNGEIKYKEFAFSQVETYQLDETEVAIVRGYQSKGFKEYGETAYAFKLGDEWVDYGIPDENSKPIIENRIKGEEIKIYKTAGDINE